MMSETRASDAAALLELIGRARARRERERDYHRWKDERESTLSRTPLGCDADADGKLQALGFLAKYFSLIMWKFEMIETYSVV